MNTFRGVNFIHYAIIITGIVALFLGWNSENWFFQPYKLLIEFYLFGFTSFLILKRVFFYRIKGNIDVIHIGKASAYQGRLVWHGVFLGSIYLAFNYLYFGTLSNANTIILLILLLYYFVQLNLNSKPSIYIDEASFSYDDYFVDRWGWNEVERIELEDQKMRLVSSTRDFELDFDLVDAIDYVKLNEEVEHNVLDGEFSSGNSSKTLVDILSTYSELYNLRLVRIRE